MKKKLITALLAVVMLVSLAPCAVAEAPMPEATVGQYYDQPLPDTGNAINYSSTLPGEIVSPLPPGMSIGAAVNSAGVQELHLKGTPVTAGTFTFQVYVAFSGSPAAVLSYSINITAPAAPAAPDAPSVSTSGEVSCNIGSQFTVSVFASVSNGTLSYQWYSNTTGNNFGGTYIANANTPSLTLTATVPEDMWFYCSVTNTLNGSNTTVNSNAIHVLVIHKDVSFVQRLTDPIKTEYKVGEKPDLTGMSVSVQYTDGSSELVNDPALFTVEPQKLTAGTTMLTVSFQGSSFMVPVSVKNAVELVAPPSKVNYKVGDVLDTSGIIIRVFSGNGYTDITDGFTCSPTTLTRTGSQNITVIYNGDSVTFTVYVEAASKDTRLEILTAPTKLQYNLGDTLDTSGMTLRLWTGNDYKDITYGFSCSPNVLGVAGDSQTVTVRYGTASATFTVSVKGEDTPNTPKPTVTPGTVTVQPSFQPKDDNNNGSSSAPTAIIIIAVLIAGAALAGAVTYICLLKKNRQEPDGEEEEEAFDAGEYFPPKPPTVQPRPRAPYDDQNYHDPYAPQNNQGYRGQYTSQDNPDYRGPYTPPQDGPDYRGPYVPQDNPGYHNPQAPQGNPVPPEGEHPVHKDLTPDKTDYFEGLFDDK